MPSTTLPHRFTTAFACGLAAMMIGLVMLAPAPALAAAPVHKIPAGTLVDESFDVSAPAVTINGGTPAGRVACPDRNFTALIIRTNSVLGCNVIGTSNNVKVYYGWATSGDGYATINARGFNKDRKPTWYSAGSGTGRTIAINWGNVAASKQIQGISNVVQGVQLKFS